MKETILIIGANGTIGTELTKQLENQGYNLRLATSKTPESNQYVQVNLETGEGLKDAFTNVDRAFLLSPPGYADQYKILSQLIQEARQNNLSKVVLMTAMGANADDSSPFRRAELELIQSELKYNIVRPNWFLQNFNTFWVQDILEHKQINLPAGDAKVSFVDTRDVSAVIAKLLTSEEFDNQEFDLSGPEAIDHNDVAAKIGNKIHSSVIYSDVQPAVLQNGLLQAGLPGDYVDFLLLIFSFLKAGYNATITDNISKILNRTPRGLDDYVADYQSAWA